MSVFTKHIERNILFLSFGTVGGNNIIREEWFDGLKEALDQAANDPHVRCVHLSAEGKSFCSGADLKIMSSTPFPDGVMQSSLARFLERLETFDKPIVAVVHGATVGAGSTALPHFDFVYAEQGTTFQFPFSRLGIVPELGSSLLFQQQAGARLANELILLGRPFDTDTAIKAGLINEALARPELEARAAQVAQDLAELPPLNLRTTKRLLRNSYRSTYSSVWREECQLLEQYVAGDENKEACAAFLERRKPDFSRFQ